MYGYNFNHSETSVREMHFQVFKVWFEVDIKLADHHRGSLNICSGLTLKNLKMSV